MELCLKSIKSNYKFADIQDKKCHLPKNHDGKCIEFPFVSHLKSVKKTVADKIVRDSTNTTGAAWKSDDAGPNRILRWGMLLEDDELVKYGINMVNLKPGVQAKLREKAAPYDDCIEVAIKLTWLVYCMEDAPFPPEDLKIFLEFFHGPIDQGITVCEICKEKLSFELFNQAQRGKAALETCHKNPRIHNANNVGFGHRECNIAQGNKTLDEFYEWLQLILKRAGRI
ncbi:hypothetical protein [Bacillus sp. SKDU12]|uniref:hypothetical protein n=1 Tax=Bacillus sp. SKDU12 TaxID=1337053 RepID=UPI00138A5AB8|nr:hypothetical protein BTW01_12025 [Bacillus sp. SKDU12]